ncbi:SPOR domain-containing protein [Vibrio quintilis]|uniref:Cell division protein FtsN n=1 Tax=Vibrio quintilis TaxID=1117707 RepID=A0A1M7YYN6_9VIBR|nr:SPOR domain-containing protein [Vibrio quintilis]SHO57682.1 Cell division protein FtsN [Vibrio quintilis]
MANKDYVRRGSSPRKKAPSKKTKAPQRRRSARPVISAVILVSAFGYGLYKLSVQPEPPVKEQHAPAAKPKPVSQPKPKPAKSGQLPPPPTEKWDYVETLPKREIEVTPKELKVSEIPYIMQCGAYKTLHQAEKRKLDIAFQGLNSKVRKKENSNWYRVVLGPYKFRRDAERDKHKLQRAKIEPCAIWKERQ